MPIRQMKPAHLRHRFPHRKQSLLATTSRCLSLADPKGDANPLLNRNRTQFVAVRETCSLPAVEVFASNLIRDTQTRRAARLARLSQPVYMAVGNLESGPMTISARNSQALDI